MKKKVLIIIITIIALILVSIAYLLYSSRSKYFIIGDCKTDCPMSCIGPDEDCKNYCDCLCNDNDLGTIRESLCSSQANLPNQICVQEHFRNCVFEQNKTPKDCEVYSINICNPIAIK